MAEKQRVKDLITIDEDQEIKDLTFEDVLKRIGEIGAPEVISAASRGDTTPEEAIQTLQILHKLQKHDNKTRSRSNVMSAVLIRMGLDADAVGRVLGHCLKAKKFIPMDDVTVGKDGKPQRKIKLEPVDDFATQAWAADTILKVLGYYFKEPKDPATIKAHNVIFEAAKDVENMSVEELLARRDKYLKTMKDVNVKDIQDAQIESDADKGTT